MNYGYGSPEYSPYGYTYLGPTAVPSDAMYVGMVDRDTGVVWYLCFDPCYGGRIALVDSSEVPFSKYIATRVYEAYDGPYVGAQGLRLGIRNGHLVYDQSPGSEGSPPWAFDLSGNRRLWLYLYPTNHDNPNTWDHLAYDGIPWFFFGLTDRDTGTVYYVVLDHDTGRVGLQQQANVPGPIQSRIHVYPAFQGPGIGQEGIQLGVRGGHMLWEISTKQFVLLQALGFESLGGLTEAALFGGTLLDGQAGVAQQLPDHVTYSVISPIINECPDGPGSYDTPIMVLVTDDDEIILSDDDTIEQPDDAITPDPFIPA